MYQPLYYCTLRQMLTCIHVNSWIPVNALYLFSDPPLVCTVNWSLPLSMPFKGVSLPSQYFSVILWQFQTIGWHMHGRFTTSFTVLVIDEITLAQGFQFGGACNAGAVEYVTADGCSRRG